MTDLIRVNITITDAIREQGHEEARRRGMSFSSFVRLALLQQLSEKAVRSASATDKGLGWSAPK